MIVVTDQEEPLIGSELVEHRPHVPMQSALAVGAVGRREVPGLVELEEAEAIAEVLGVPARPGEPGVVGGRDVGVAVDVEAAVEAAEKAFTGWKRTTPSERAALLRRAADMFNDRLEQIARMVATETGNALRTQARGETMALPACFHYYAGLCSELKGDTIPLNDNVLSYTRREPYGVVGAIGVIGPTRMNYARIIPMVDYTARVVSRLLGNPEK